MQAFIVLLAVASASAFWPAYPTGYTAGMVGSPLMYHNYGYMGMPVIKSDIKPIVYKTIKPEEYVKTHEYKEGAPEMINPYFYNMHKVVKMPEVQQDYAMKGQYHAQAPGTNVVHMAKRSAEEEKEEKKIWSPFTPYMTPYMTNSWSPYVANTWAASPYVANTWAATPYMPYHGMPIIPVPAKPTVKVIGNDREKAAISPDYAMKGQYFADNGAVQHLAKRDADSDSLLYRTVGYPTVAQTMYNSAFPRTLVNTYKTPLVNTYKTPLINAYNTPLVGSTYGLPAVNTYTNTFANNVYGQRYINNAGLWY